jgi:hypothetical protein
MLLCLPGGTGKAPTLYILAKPHSKPPWLADTLASERSYAPSNPVIDAVPPSCPIWDGLLSVFTDHTQKTRAQVPFFVDSLSYSSLSTYLCCSLGSINTLTVPLPRELPVHSSQEFRVDSLRSTLMPHTQTPGTHMVCEQVWK